MSAARILDVEPDAYHKLPQFSASLAKIVIGQSLLKAKDAWDRRAERLAEEDESDGDEGVSDEKRKRLDNGSIQHALALGKGKRIEVIPSSALSKSGSYGTDKSKALRDGARAAGRIPVKEPEMEIHERVSTALRARIVEAGHTLDGTSELAIEWTENTPHGSLVCRAMLDHVVLWGIHEVINGAPGAIIYDLKIVGDAHPDRCERTAENLHYAIQAAAYTRALTALYPQLGGRIEFRFLFCEMRRPYDLWDPKCSGPFREIGERRWLRAVRSWAEGLATNRWTGYRTPDRVEISAPMWTLKQEGYQSDDF